MDQERDYLLTQVAAAIAESLAEYVADSPDDIVSWDDMDADSRRIALYAAEEVLSNIEQKYILVPASTQSNSMWLN